MSKVNLIKETKNFLDSDAEEGDFLEVVNSFCSRIKKGDIIFVTAGRLFVSLNNPSVTWGDKFGGSIIVRKLEEGEKIEITI